MGAGSGGQQTGPIAVTDRVELWRPSAADLHPMFDIISAGDTARYLGVQEGLADHAQRFFRNAGSWFLYGYGATIIRLRETGEIIGNCGIFHTWRGLGPDFDDRPEAGWILRHDQTGKGLAFEAVTAAISWFEREFGPQPIVCMISPGNTPSLALAGKLGFRFTRDAVLANGEEVKLFSRPPTQA